MIETGKILQQRYRIDKQIGQGGMGAVYVATDERFGSTVAIKETLCMDNNYRKAIEREARLLNSLKHVALPRVSDHFLEENGQFLVMEYIPGEDLACILEERGEPFPVEQVLIWADQLLDALEFLHTQENPVIHRDIKPQNLKITPKGQIILLDFGLAKGHVTGASKHTNKSIFGYSRNYASLEQIQGTGTDPRSDLYSLAATLYHLLTNVPPEDALTRAMAVLSQKPDPLVPANRIRPEIPTGVAAILHKALDLDAAERPATAREMRNMISDHPEHSDLVVSSVTVARGNNPDIHSQKTQLLPGVTVNEGLRATDAMTEVLPDNTSQVTALRPFLSGRETDGSAGQNGRSPQTRTKRAAAIAAAAGSLVLLAVIGAGAYMLDGQLLWGPATEVPVVEAPETPAAVSEIQNEGSVSVSSAESGTEPVTAEAASKKTESAKPDKTGKSDPASDSNVNVDLGDDKIVVEGDKITIGNVTVKDGKVIFPDGSVIDGVEPPTNRTHPVPPVIPNVDLRRLTPEQRRKLRLLRERYPGAFPPAPSATPN